jgi:phosphotransferase system IIA component
MIHWLSQLSDVTGLPVKSPASGVIQPLNKHPDLLYNSNILPQALCIELQHGTLISPFTGQFSCQLLSGRRLCFKHNSGLTVQLDLPAALNHVPACALKPLVPSGQRVQAGQAVVKLDLQLLSANEGQFAVLMVLPHPAISAVFSAERLVDAAQDTAIIIQLKNR